MTRNEPETPESHEPSYYEIALTNRQVVGAFVVLLACLLAAFLGGMWVGRESAAREAEDALRSAPPQVADKAGAGEKGEKGERLDFFSVPQGSAKLDPADKAKPTLREDLDRRDQTAGAAPTGKEGEAATSEEEAPPPPIAAAPPPPAPPVTKTPPANPPAAAGKERAEKETKAPAKGRSEKPGKTEKAEKTDTEPPKGSFVVQVFSTSEKDQAVKVKSRLQTGGEKAYLSPVQAAKGTMYRVRIGPFTSRDAAQKVADKVRKGYKLDTWVTQ